MDWILDRVVNHCRCGASISNTKVTDLLFPDDAVLLAETLEVLVAGLESLRRESRPFGLEVSWTEIKVQEFGGLLDDTVQIVHAYGEDIEVLGSFMYLGNIVHNGGGSYQDVLRRIGISHGDTDSFNQSIWRRRYS
ncbi:uncharacterized protein LOC143029977 [Oratosquilla oratoria]|uniref:uncharacterized protein LOC143029977 n=1 Tax=Oratosquilla oratoria TaxID=337810 RepID=UPI003F773869